MEEEYEALTFKFDVIATKEYVLEYVEKLIKIIEITKTPKIELEVKMKELKPSKDWQPKKLESGAK